MLLRLDSSVENAEWMSCEKFQVQALITAFGTLNSDTFRIMSTLCMCLLVRKFKLKEGKISIFLEVLSILARDFSSKNFQLSRSNHSISLHLYVTVKISCTCNQSQRVMFWILCYKQTEAKIKLLEHLNGQRRKSQNSILHFLVHTQSKPQSLRRVKTFFKRLHADLFGAS